MTTLIKTQCPCCQGYFNITQAQSNEPDTNLQCASCQQVFLVGDLRQTTDDNLLTIDDSLVDKEVSPSKLAQNIFENTSHTKSTADTKNKKENSSSNELIYDDMPIDDSGDVSENISKDYSSLDEMDAWLSKLAATPAAATQKSPQSSQPAKGAGSVDDNVWLEKLLEEQDGGTDKAINSSSSSNEHANTDLSQLLTSMGVPANDQNHLRIEPADKIQSRSHPAQNRMQNSAASVLWVAGCLVLIMLLFAQYVIFNLDHLIKNPAHAARLQAVCAIAACSLPSADVSALEVTDIMYRPSKIRAANEFSDIAATLANQSAQAQLLPSLKVSIYNDDALIGEFIAAPEDYLASTQYQLSAETNKAFMFTVPIANHKISQVTVDPIY